MISTPYQPAAFKADYDMRFFAARFKPNFHIAVFIKITFHQRLTLRNDT